MEYPGQGSSEIPTVYPQPRTSLLSLLAEVASEKLKNDPTVRKIKSLSDRKAARNCEGRTVTLLQASSMSENALLKHFSLSQSNEIKRKFYYTCHMVPLCDHTTHSFGNEDRARTEMKRHLQQHLRSLLQANNTVSSQEDFILHPVEKQKFRPYNENRFKKWHHKNESKGWSILSLSEKENSEGSSTSLPVKTLPSKPLDPSSDREKLQTLKVIRPNSLPNPTFEPFQKPAVPKASYKLKIGHPNVVEMSQQPSSESVVKSDTNWSLIKEEEHEVKMEFSKVNPGIGAPPIMAVKFMGECVSHDHGYIGSAQPSSIRISIKEEEEKDHRQSILQQELLKPTKVCNDVSLPTKQELVDEEDTLLVQHMTKELRGGMMAQDGWSDDTPLPLVGSEVDFQPEDCHVSSVSMDKGQTPPTTGDKKGQRKLWKQTKGKAKFIGQSKAEKEMALRLIEDMKLHPLPEDLECRICSPPRFFTAPSTLLSHYKSHAGIRPYVCSICESVFTRQHSLNYHMLIHSNQTRFTCEDCGRKFRHPSHFKEHRRRHTGESPYQCVDCGTRFKTRNTYKRHLRTRHYKLLTTQGEILKLSSASTRPDDPSSERDSQAHPKNNLESSDCTNPNPQFSATSPEIQSDSTNGLDLTEGSVGLSATRSLSTAEDSAVRFCAPTLNRKIQGIVLRSNGHPTTVRNSVVEVESHRNFLMNASSCPDQPDVRVVSRPEQDDRIAFSSAVDNDSLELVSVSHSNPDLKSLVAIAKEARSIPIGGAFAPSDLSVPYDVRRKDLNVSSRSSQEDVFSPEFVDENALHSLKESRCPSNVTLYAHDPGVSIVLDCGQDGSSMHPASSENIRISCQLEEAQPILNELEHFTMEADQASYVGTSPDDIQSPSISIVGIPPRGSSGNVPQEPPKWDPGRVSADAWGDLVMEVPLSVYGPEARCERSPQHRLVSGGEGEAVR